MMNFGLIGNPDYPKSLSSDDNPVRPGLGLQPGPHQPFGHGVELVATIEAPGEAGEVALRVLLADVVVGAGERRLDVAEGGIDPVEGRPLRRFLPTAEGLSRCSRFRWHAGASRRIMRYGPVIRLFDRIPASVSGRGELRAFPVRAALA